jgi:hypothetical protein
MGQLITKAILEMVARSVLKWGELAHVLLAINKEFDTKWDWKMLQLGALVKGGHRLSQEITIAPANIEVSDPSE